MLKSSAVVFNFPMSNLSNVLFKLFKLIGTFFNSSMSNLSTSDFKLAKSVFSAKDDASTPVAFFEFVLLHN